MKPGSTARSRAKLVSISPAPMSSISASATSPTTSSFCVRVRAVPVRPPSFSASVDIARARPETPGTMPNSTPTAADATTQRRRRADRGARPRAAESTPARAPASAVDAPVGDEQAEQSAGAGEHQALGQQLPDQAAASGAERGADRELAAPRRRRAPAAGWRRSRTRSAARSPRRRAARAGPCARRRRGSPGTGSRRADFAFVGVGMLARESLGDRPQIVVGLRRA